MRSSESRLACSSSTTRMVPRLSIAATIARESARTVLRLFGEERLDELVRVELLEVGHLLADAHVAHGNLQLLADADDHAALGRAVELGEHEPRHSQRLVELPRLLDGVLAVGRVH